MPRSLLLLVLLIAVFASVAAAIGIFSSGGPGPTTHISVRGETVTLWGRGVYRHMSKDVAPQGIAQDVVTLCVGVPMLLFAAFRGSRRLLAGVLFYFFVTYLFYLAMGTYNVLFLVYAALAGMSAWAAGIALTDAFRRAEARRHTGTAPGTFLMVVAVMIALLWMSIVVPPLLDGTIVPREVEHYTTLIVQGFDLGLLLPLGLVAGLLYRRATPFGLLVAPPYLVFLALLMTALTAKILAMGYLGQNVMPVIVIIPVINALAVYFAARALRGEPVSL